VYAYTSNGFEGSNNNIIKEIQMDSKKRFDKMDRSPLDTILSTEEDPESWICCLCGRRYRGFGNNPAPLKNSGRCCDDCNEAIVFPTRLYLSTGGEN
jgi:hypothetical protein